VRKYFALVKTSLKSSVAYRADFLLWGLSELLDTIVFIFIWLVIFGERNSIGGFTLAETITYLIGVGIIGNLIYTWVGMDLEADIKSGQLSNTLIKPISYPLARVVSNIAEKPLDVFIRMVVYFIVSLFFANKFILNTNTLYLLLTFLSIIFAIMINYQISFLFGCLAFWTTSTSRGIFGLLRTISSIFSGSYAPLTFFPILFQTIASFLPFIYTRYFPMLIYLKKISMLETVKGIGIQILWIFILYFVAKVVWKKGIRKYEGVGI